MKILLALFLLLPLMTGCATLERLDSIRSSAEKLIEENLDSAAMATAPTDGSLLTREEAEALALAHAKLNRGQVSRVRTKYEWEDGRHTYEVEFHQGQWEYDYVLDAQTGEVLSWERETEK